MPDTMINNITDEGAARERVQALFANLRAGGNADHTGEDISLLPHSLRTAALAAADASPSDEEMILAALLHNVGCLVPKSEMIPPVTEVDGKCVDIEDREALGKKYLRDLGFGDKISSVVGAQIWAKRYLCATEPGYWQALSESNKKKLESQVGHR